MHIIKEVLVEWRGLDWELFFNTLFNAKVIPKVAIYLCDWESFKFHFTTAMKHSYDILGVGMLWKPKEARILMNFINQPVNIGKHSRTKNVLTRCFTKNFQEF